MSLAPPHPETATPATFSGDTVAVRVRTFPRGGTTRFIDWTRLVTGAEAA